MKPKITYEWNWYCLALFRNETHSNGYGSSSSRIFTLKPAWLFQYWQNKFMVFIGKWPPDPYEECFNWMKRNNHRDKIGNDFRRAIDMYSNSCPPGEYVRLQPRFLI